MRKSRNGKQLALGSTVFLCASKVNIVSARVHHEECRKEISNCYSSFVQYFAGKSKITFCSVQKKVISVFLSLSMPATSHPRISFRVSDTACRLISASWRHLEANVTCFMAIDRIYENGQPMLLVGLPWLSIAAASMDNIESHLRRNRESYRLDGPAHACLPLKVIILVGAQPIGKLVLHSGNPGRWAVSPE